VRKSLQIRVTESRETVADLNRKKKKERERERAVFTFRLH